jgi:hypothetical protein
MKIGFSELLFLILFTLKLTGYIDLSWLWVLSPLIIDVGLMFGMAIFVGIVGGAIEGVKKAARR